MNSGKRCQPTAGTCPIFQLSRCYARWLLNWVKRCLDLYEHRTVYSGSPLQFLTTPARHLQLYSLKITGAAPKRCRIKS